MTRQELRITLMTLRRTFDAKTRRTAGGKAGLWLWLALALLVSVGRNASAGAAPTVNGLFYGDGDEGRYVLYNTSIGGSRLWYTVVSNRLYVALVVDRSVNDNVFSSKSNREYTRNAGWNPPHQAKKLVDSEYAQFTLTVGSTIFQWNQGNGALVDGVWKSDHTTGAGSGQPPPGYVSSSSFAWNINNYLANPAPAWDLYVNGTGIEDWKSPFDPAAPDTVVGLEGYPATGPITYSPTYQYEWAMVYEWSADLSSFGPEPVFVISGQSHHSPGKSGSENDPFPDPPGNGYLSDYGDLPAPYPTLLADNGPCHYLVPNGAFLGALADPEPDGLPDDEALGDDASGSDDEDGVTLVGQLVAGSEVIMRITAGTPGYLSAFIDWEGDGTLEPLSFSSATGPTTLTSGTVGDMELTNGVYELTLTVPHGVGRQVAARFRFTNLAGGNSPVGTALTGEVEDYVWHTRNPSSSGVDLQAYQGADGVYVEFVAHDVEEDGYITLFLMGPDGQPLWYDSVAVEAGGDFICRFLVPGLEAGSAYNFALQDEVGQLWEAWNVPVKPFAADMIRMSLAGVTLSFESLPEREYAIQWTPRLGAPWQTVMYVLSEGTQTKVVVRHPEISSSPSGFFRIVLQ